MNKDRFKFRLPFYNNNGEFSHFQYVDIVDGLKPYNAGVMFHRGEYEQCTGLKDKNGNLIYEGDIVALMCPRYLDTHDKEYEYVVKFGKYEQDGSGGEYSPVMCVGFYGEATSDYEIKRNSVANIARFDWDIEIIGNIHEQKDNK